jgi:hypothetical protein
MSEIIQFKRMNLLSGSIGNLQLTIEPTNDPDLGFKMLGYRDGSSVDYKLLAKNQAASVKSVKVTDFGTVGFVKNDVLGNLIGGQSISGGDLPNHNDFGGLQGGQAGQYYHINNDKYNQVDLISGGLSNKNILYSSTGGYIAQSSSFTYDNVTKLFAFGVVPKIWESGAGIGFLQFPGDDIEMGIGTKNGDFNYCCSHYINSSGQSIRSVAGPSTQFVQSGDSYTFKVDDYSGEAVDTVITNWKNIFSITIDGCMVGSTIAPDGLLHIHAGSAGIIAASGGANGIVVESGASGGMSFLTPNGNPSSIFFGSPANNQGANLQWMYDGKVFVVGTHYVDGEVAIRSGSDITAIYINKNQFVGIGCVPTNGNFLEVGGNTRIGDSGPAGTLLEARKDHNGSTEVQIRNNTGGLSSRCGINIVGASCNGTFFAYDTAHSITELGDKLAIRTYSAAALAITTESGIPIEFYTGGVSTNNRAIIIDSDQRIGIKATPDTKWDTDYRVMEFLGAVSGSSIVNHAISAPNDGGMFITSGAVYDETSDRWEFTAEGATLVGTRMLEGRVTGWGLYGFPVGHAHAIGDEIAWDSTDVNKMIVDASVVGTVFNVNRGDYDTYAWGDAASKVMYFNAGSGSLGISTTSPLDNVGTSAGDFTGIGLHAENLSGAGYIIVEGTTGANVVLCDSGGAVNDKMLQMVVDDGTYKIFSVNDNITARVGNILVIDLGSGHIGIGKVPSYKLDLDLATNDLSIEDVPNNSTGNVCNNGGYVKIRAGSNTRYIQLYTTPGA